MTTRNTGSTVQTVKRFEEVKAYQHVAAQCDSRRLAHFANWASEKMPGVFIPYNVAFRAIFACARTPAPDSTESKKIRGIVSRANVHLKTDYGKAMLTERGIGFRATENDTSLLKIAFPQAGQRAKSALRSFQEVRGLIHISNVPKTAENLPFIEHFKQGAGLLDKVFEPKMLAAFVYEAPPAKKPDKPEK